MGEAARARAPQPDSPPAAPTPDRAEPKRGVAVLSNGDALPMARVAQEGPGDSAAPAGRDGASGAPSKQPADASCSEASGRDVGTGAAELALARAAARGRDAEAAESAVDGSDWRAARADSSAEGAEAFPLPGTPAEVEAPPPAERSEAKASKGRLSARVEDDADLPVTDILDVSAAPAVDLTRVARAAMAAGVSGDPASPQAGSAPFERTSPAFALDETTRRALAPFLVTEAAVSDSLADAEAWRVGGELVEGGECAGALGGGFDEDEGEDGSDPDGPSVATDPEEPLLQETEDRFCLLPVTDPETYEFYKKAQASYWTTEEVDLAQDYRDWARLSESERRFILYVLAFFAASDGIVLENLGARFMKEITLAEARAFYAFQAAIETVHNETYGLLLETYVEDPPLRAALFRAVQTLPTVGAKARWAQRWIEDERACFAERLLAFACVEGILFSGSFCSIFWLKKRLLMPGLTFSNELISRDEGLHTDFACHLYSRLKRRLSQRRAHRIVREAVDLERSFCCAALSVELVGMNAKAMAQYIEFVADRLLVALGYERMYHSTNPFDFMEQISLQGKTNFFERRVGDYQMAGVMQSAKRAAGQAGQFEHVFTLDADF